MKKFTLLITFWLTAIAAFSQQQYSIYTYRQLKEFEGLYEYRNQSPFKIAASPKDTLLYAIINDTKFELTQIGKDLFISKAQEKIQFFRNSSNKIIGYILDDTKFKLLSKKVEYPIVLWYARLDTLNEYNYEQPKDGNDGLQSGNIDKSGLDASLLNEMMLKIINGTYANVHSVLIVKDGKLVFEEYFYEYTREKLHELRSATKSFVSALAGIAIDKGYIKSTDETVLSFFPEYSIKNNSEAKRRITIENLLTNQSGLDCDITNPKSEGHENKMNNSDDWVKFTLDLPMIDSAGTMGRYCSGNTILTGRIIEKQTKMTLPKFAEQTLFKDLGITNYVWNFKPDKSSTETICEVFLNSRDMAKFGLLFLNKGQWNGKQVISPHWIKQSLSKHSVIQGVDYGYFWWIKYLDADGVRYFGKAAQGNGGQKIFIWEEQNMVTIITGGNYNIQSPSDELISKYILPAFNK
ncbi:serine hydrolase [Telluribacter sp.]|jgi:CubicO group peptidase (beta-lactamase class C family)|uniref:serine hydrolase domain-containing protein n=1 Tax=Telluribacter sp. TaxID=1978767 RepID=UPI002E159970|nr:serine hydrolase [Telluribacter sp.]